MRRALVALVAAGALGCSGLYTGFDGGADGGEGGGGGGGGTDGGGGSGGGGEDAGSDAGTDGGVDAGVKGPLDFVFTRITPPAEARLISVHGTSPTNLWVGAEGGALYFFDGTNWTPVTNFGQQVHSLYASPDGALVAKINDTAFRCAVACGNSGASFANWHKDNLVDQRGVCGAGSSAVYSGGFNANNDSIIFAKGAFNFGQVAYTMVVKEIRNCAVTRDGRVLFVGKPDVFTFIPDAGQSVETPALSALGADAPNQQWRSVASGEDGLSFAVGRARRVMRRDLNGNWTLVFDPGNVSVLEFRGVAIPRPGEIWVGGDGVGTQGLAWSTDGGFQFTAHLSGAYVYAMWAASPDVMFIVGEEAGAGAVWRATR